MKRVKDLLAKTSREYFIEALKRRRSYYFARIRSWRSRDEIIEKYLKSTKCRKLHLGCGGNLLPGWLNSDILDIRSGMIFIDVRDKLPFGNDTFDFVYSEHLLEHLTYDEGRCLIKECFRILNRDGVFRLATPNLGFLTEFYVNDSKENSNYLQWATDSYLKCDVYSKALVINHYFRSWGHKCIYDFPLLRKTCEDGGFRDMTIEAVGRSRFPELRNVERHGDFISERWNIKESLVVESKK